MKSMEEHISEIYKKYRKTKENNEIYEKVTMKPRKPLATLCIIALGVIIIVGVIILIFSKI